METPDLNIKFHNVCLHLNFSACFQEMFSIQIEYSYEFFYFPKLYFCNASWYNLVFIIELVGSSGLSLPLDTRESTHSWSLRWFATSIRGQGCLQLNFGDFPDFIAFRCNSHFRLKVGDDQHPSHFPQHTFLSVFRMKTQSFFEIIATTKVNDTELYKSNIISIHKCKGTAVHWKTTRLQLPSTVLRSQHGMLELKLHLSIKMQEMTAARQKFDEYLYPFFINLF